MHRGMNEANRLCKKNVCFKSGGNVLLLLLSYRQITTLSLSLSLPPERLYNSNGRDLRRALFSLKQIFQVTHTYFTCNYCQFVVAEYSWLLWPLCASMMTGISINVAFLSPRVCVSVWVCVALCVGVCVCVCVSLYFEMRGVSHLKHQGLFLEHTHKHTHENTQI